MIYLIIPPVALWLGFYVFFHIWADQTKQNTLTAFNPVQLAIGFCFVLIDGFVDIFYGTLLFVQWPSFQRLMLSTRMDDLIRNGTGWRRWLAIQIVGRLLEPYDLTGQHTTYGAFK